MPDLNLPTSPPAAHLGFSQEALQARADESTFVQSDEMVTRAEIARFVVELVAANNAALFIDYQVLNKRCDQLLARVSELELLSGVAEDMSV